MDNLPNQHTTSLAQQQSNTQMTANGRIHNMTLQFARGKVIASRGEENIV